MLLFSRIPSAGRPRDVLPPDYKPTLLRTLRPYEHGLLVVRNQYLGHSLIVSLTHLLYRTYSPDITVSLTIQVYLNRFPRAAVSRGGQRKQPHQNKMMASTRRSKLTLEVDHHHAAACLSKSCGFAMGKGKNKGFKEKVGHIKLYGQPHSRSNIFNPTGTLALFNPAL